MLLRSHRRTQPLPAFLTVLVLLATIGLTLDNPGQNMGSAFAQTSVVSITKDASTTKYTEETTKTLSTWIAQTSTQTSSIQIITQTSTTETSTQTSSIQIITQTSTTETSTQTSNATGIMEIVTHALRNPITATIAITVAGFVALILLVRVYMRPSEDIGPVVIGEESEKTSSLLEELEDLYTQGVLSAEEYVSKRAKLESDLGSQIEEGNAKEVSLGAKLSGNIDEKLISAERLLKEGLITREKYLSLVEKIKSQKKP
jgi:uncharacterized protein YqgQ